MSDPTADGVDGRDRVGCAGVTRLHYTLATGNVISKAGAGVYALDTVPERWHPIIREALRIRNGSSDDALYRGDPLAQCRDMQAFVGMVIDKALRLPGHSSDTRMRVVTRPGWFIIASRSKQEDADEREA